MAYFISTPRWSDAWEIYADSTDTVSDIEDELDELGAPVGSQIIQAASSAAPDVYTKFPSSWEQTGGTFS